MACELIAELATVWGGDPTLLHDYIFQCREAGADWVKTQSFQVATLRPGDPQTAWLTQCELSDDLHNQVKAWCQEAGVKWLTTVFHVSRVPFLASLGLEAIKIGSGEAREDGLVKTCMGLWAGKTFVSVAPDYGYNADVYWSDCIYFKCVGRYPSPLEFSRHWARQSFRREIAWCGWSDHCVSTLACEDAIMSGAQYVEKHMQFPTQKRPAQPWEMTLAELRQLRAFVDNGPQKFLGRWQHNL